jgi:hypothetical protein
VIKYNWREWLALELAGSSASLECDDKYSSDGLDEFMDWICGDYMDELEAKPSEVSICKPSYLELNCQDLINGLASPDFSIEEAISEELYNHTYFCEYDPEWSAKDTIGLRQLERSINVFAAIHRPLFWLYNGWDIDDSLRIFPLSAILRLAVTRFNQENKEKFVLFEPTEDVIQLDKEYWQLIISGVETV